jgi:hypothetical protein
VFPGTGKKEMWCPPPYLCSRIFALLDSISTNKINNLYIIRSYSLRLMYIQTKNSRGLESVMYC